MKYLIFILFTITTYSQQVSIGFDVSNSMYGSDVNSPSLDYQVKLTSLESWGEIGIQFEQFKEIDFISWGIHANKVFELSSFELLGGIEVIQIIRKNLGIFSYGFNGEIRYFYRNIGIGAQLNYRYRKDLEFFYEDGRFVESGFINLIYRW